MRARLEIIAEHEKHYPLCVESRVLYSRRGRELFRWTDLRAEPEWVGELTFPAIVSVLSRFRPFERLLRLGITHLAAIPNRRRVLVANKMVFAAEAESQSWTLLGKLGAWRRPGGRPMRFGVGAARDGTVYIGVYSSNPLRRRVDLLAVVGDRLEPAYSFGDGEVRHIHAVQEDPFTGSVWLTTGDYGNECRILKSADGFKTVEVVGSGDQSWRATCLLFREDAVLWGMDSPTERSFVIRYDRDTGEREFVADVRTPVWHGCVNEMGWSSFSTAVEPTATLKDDRARLWSSRDGRNFVEVASYRKDRWPQKFFQSGLIYFPTGVMPTDHLIFSGQGLEGIDDKMLIARLRS